MNNLPKLTTAQKIGIEAADYLSAKFTKTIKMIPIPQSIDLGIDFYCEILDNEDPTGICFNIQCKGTIECEEDENDFFSMSLKIKTMNYWKLQRDPTFIFLVDLANEFVYWAYPFPNTSIYKSIDLIEKEQKSDPTNSIRIPKANKLIPPIESLPIGLVQIIHEYHSSSLNHTSNILKTLHSKLNQSGDIISVLLDIKKIHLIIENALSSISTMTNEIRKIQSEVIDIITTGIERLSNIITMIDCTPESKMYLRDRSILQEKFGNYTPTEIKDLISSTLNLYEINPTIDNFNSVVSKTKILSDYINKLIYFYNELEMDEKIITNGFVDTKLFLTVNKKTASN